MADYLGYDVIKDPYFQQVYGQGYYAYTQSPQQGAGQASSPQYYQHQQQALPAVQEQVQIPQQVLTEPSASVNFKASAPKEEKKGKGGLWALLSLVVIGGATLMCHGKGNAAQKFFPRVVDGAKQYWKDAGKLWKNCTGWLKGTGKKAATTEENTVKTTISNFRDAGNKFEKGIAKTAYGENYTGVITHTGKKDGTIFELTYNDGKLVKSVKNGKLFKTYEYPETMFRSKSYTYDAEGNIIGHTLIYNNGDISRYIGGKDLQSAKEIYKIVNNDGAIIKRCVKGPQK